MSHVHPLRLSTEQVVNITRTESTLPEKIRERNVVLTPAGGEKGPRKS